MSAWQCRHRYNRLAFALTSFSRSDFQKNFRIYSFKNYQLTTSPISNAFPRKKGSSYHKMNPWKLCDKVFDKVFNYSSFYLVIRDFWDPLSIKLSPSNSSLLNVPELWIRTYNILVIQLKNKVDQRSFMLNGTFMGQKTETIRFSRFLDFFREFLLSLNFQN